MTGVGDPVAEMRGRLQELLIQVRRPTYRSLATHAELEGRVLRPSTVSDLLNGPGVPRWDTVETFVRACARHARARQVTVSRHLVDLDDWHDSYRRMQSAVDDRTAPPRRVPARRRVIPAQLPATTAVFAGRTGQLAELDALLAGCAAGEGAAGTGAVAIAAIHGTAGVGKTALAIHWAHRVAERFPDGQLYVNLRGFHPGGQLLDPATVLAGFLDALAVPPDRVPTELAARAALYRSVLADKRMLVVLDNARDTAQVRPLLPGTPGCFVVVTSRNQLTSMIADHGAHPVTLDVLTPDEAHDLLTRRLGADRTNAEPAATEEIITRCARLPLALTIVAAHAALRPRATLASLAGQLRDRGHRWHTLAGDDPSTDVRVVFSWSYHTLSPAAARLFRLIGLHPAPDISEVSAAALLAVPLSETRPLLAELTRAHLLTRYRPGLYTWHDLLRDYATELADGPETEDERADAMNRLLSFVSSTEALCHDVPLTPPAIDVTAPATESALPAPGVAWLPPERKAVHELVRLADSARPDGHFVRLGLRVIFDPRDRWSNLATLGFAALTEATRRDDRTGQALAHSAIGAARRATGQYDAAQAHLTRAVDLYAAVGDLTGQARAHQGLAQVAWYQDRRAECLYRAERILALTQASGALEVRACGLGVAAWWFGLCGRHRPAVGHCRRALAMCREAADPMMAAEFWSILGFIRCRAGAPDRAVACYRRAIDLFHSAGFWYNEARTLSQLGDAVRATGNPTAAAELHRQALDILIELEDPNADAVRLKLATGS